MNRYVNVKASKSYQLLLKRPLHKRRSPAVCCRTDCSEVMRSDIRTAKRNVILSVNVQIRKEGSDYEKAVDGVGR